MVSVSVKVILPKRKFEDIRVKQEIEKAMKRETEPTLKRDFKRTIAGWKEPPGFHSKFISNSSKISISVFPYGRGKKIYNIVTLGSPKHPITAKRPSGRLRFQTGYLSATTPGMLISGKARRFGDYARTYSVEHPGFPARDFDILIADKNRSKFQDDMQKAITKAAKWK